MNILRSLCALKRRPDTKAKARPRYRPSLLLLEDRVVQARIRYAVLCYGVPVSIARDSTLVEPEAAVKDPNWLKYRNEGYILFRDPDGYPPLTPPWGTLNAIDLNKGEIRWRIPFGEYPELVALGMANTGSDNYGGPVVTAGGLLFIGATNFDKKFRAFDKLTGRLLWETVLPAAGNATPSLYELKGRQYIVIACGGGKNGAASGSSIVAFALPN